ncbi:MAG: hypothetical protein GY771_11645, partial [bacterium]|nr:hypothetical protein [bacterium]
VILKGDRELKAKLESMTKGIQNKAMRAALRKGMEPVASLAKQRAPVRTGRLQKSIKVASYRGKRGVLGAVVRTGTRRQLRITPENPYYYPSALEYGTKKRQGRSFLRSSLFDRKRQALALTEKELVKFLLTFKA